MATTQKQPLVRKFDGSYAYRNMERVAAVYPAKKPKNTASKMRGKK